MLCKGKKIVSVIVVIILTLCFVKMSSNVLSSKNSKIKYNEFWDNEMFYDVVFLGSSHMMHAVNPQIIYKNYGISSYNLANAAEAIPTSYWVLRTSLEKNKPKVAVLEVFFQSGTKVTEGQESLLHTWFDSVPISQVKQMAIEDLLPSKKVEFLYPFSLYHVRYSELSKNDFNETTDFLRGAKPLMGMYVPQEEMSKSNKVLSVNDLTMEYLEKIRLLCEQQEIELILSLHPYGVLNDNARERFNFIKEWAEHNQLKFWDLAKEEVINYSIDLADRAHVNESGADKISRWYGSKLSEVFSELCTYTNKERWDIDYEDYISYQDEKLRAETNSVNYLIYLNNAAYEVELSIPQNVENDTLNKLIENIGNLKSLFYNSDDLIVCDVYRTESDELVDHREFSIETIQ